MVLWSACSHADWRGKLPEMFFRAGSNLPRDTNKETLTLTLTFPYLLSEGDGENSKTKTTKKSSLDNIPIFRVPLRLPPLTRLMLSPPTPPHTPTRSLLHVPAECQCVRWPS